MWVPLETKSNEETKSICEPNAKQRVSPFSFMTFQSQGRIAGFVFFRERLVHGSVKDEDISRDCLGGDDVGVFVLISCSVDFAFMGDLLCHSDAGVVVAAIAPNLCSPL